MLPSKFVCLLGRFSCFFFTKVGIVLDSVEHILTSTDFAVAISVQDERYFEGVLVTSLQSGQPKFLIVILISMKNPNPIRLTI